MSNKIKMFIIFAGLFLVSIIFAEDGPAIIKREKWVFDEVNVTASGTPTSLKFFKFYDLLPDQIVLPVIENRDLSEYTGKKIYVGYGVADPRGEDCRVFPATMTGLENDTTICLPWWRIEREYEKQVLPVNDVMGLLCSLPTPKPPISVNVCKKFSDDFLISTEGGKVTCTSYYDRLAGLGCWDNPKQQECFVNNCSKYIQENCTHEGSNMGAKQELDGARVTGQTTYETVATKTNLLTYQYTCPAGLLMPNTICEEEETVLMYPYECKAEDKENSIQGEYIYCDEKKVQYGSGGGILGFLGECSDGRQVMCEVNKFASTERQCTQDITQNFTNSTYSQEANYRLYDEYEISVITGEPDIYSENDTCLRINKIQDARNQTVTATIEGAGGLDDDIYVIKHGADGSNQKVYCNMQHSGFNGSKKNYNNEMLQCIENNGNYSFKQDVQIEPTTIISIQQNTEHEDQTPEHFPHRMHYGSTEVKIDGVVAAPATWQSPTDFIGYPFAPGWGPPSFMGKGLLHIWENSTATLSLMFPYAGAYKIFFYDKNGREITNETVGMNDFSEMKGSFVQLKLGKKMPYRNDFRPNDEDACLEDDFLEIGGGVWGGKDSRTGTKLCQDAPSDNAYIKENAIHNLMVADLLTGDITPIPLVYPLAYINRVFVSKLKIYEKRKYRCYKPFTEVKIDK